DRALDRVVGEPRASRVAARAMERELRDEVPETAGLDLAVRRLEQDRERRLVCGRAALEGRRERVGLHRELLATEEEGAHVERALAPQIADQLDGDGETAPHVAGAETG